MTLHTHLLAILLVFTNLYQYPLDTQPMYAILPQNIIFIY